MPSLTKRDSKVQWPSPPSEIPNGNHAVILSRLLEAAKSVKEPESGLERRLSTKSNSGKIKYRSESVDGDKDRAKGQLETIHSNRPSVDSDGLPAIRSVSIMAEPTVIVGFECICVLSLSW